MFSLKSVVMDVFRQKVDGQKPPRTKPSRQKLPVKNLHELRQTPCKDIDMYTCTTKNWGSEMCDVL